MARIVSPPGSLTEAGRFLARYQACADALPWAAACITLEDLWHNCANPDWLLWGLKYVGFQDQVALRRWACRCVRQAWHLIGNDSSKRALEVAERFTRGAASPEELAAAWQAATAQVDGPWPSTAVAWATRAGAEAAGERFLLAAKAAAEAVAWQEPQHYAGAWAAVRAAQAELLREVVGAEAHAAVCAAWRQSCEGAALSSAGPNADIGAPLILSISRGEPSR